ncbi:metallophosphoesterase family protein [Actinomadura scrupuli]|uniref:metallophosphoesterase family protein n=1 Tax=Actinomadura scrupuli TaxID=559629 RepID=UPI003D958974
MAFGRTREWIRGRIRLPAWLRAVCRVPRRVWTRLSGVRSLRMLTVMVVGLLGGWVGMLLGGHVQTPVGPADVAMSVRPSWNGGTVIEIPPLGTLRLNSHWGPLRLQAQVAQLRPEPSRRLIENPGELDRLTDTVAGQVRHGLILLTLRAALFGVVCALFAGMVMFRSWRAALLSGGSALLGMVIVGGLAGATFNPQSVVEPRYTGLLANAPQVVGDAKTIVRKFSEYRVQLAQLVGNVSRLYAATSTLPTYEPDPTTLRVLHVSDIHLNPVAWSIIRSIAAQFQIQVVIDTGDLSDHGSKPEERFADDIASLKVPYVFIRGNHDSRSIQAAVGQQKNAVVLDGTMKEVGGLRIWGVGDPRFTPDKTTRDDGVAASTMAQTGSRLAAGLHAARVTPDVVLTHDPSEGQAFDGIAPLVLSGHTHQRSTRLLPSGTRLFVQGSTGGAGLRGLEGEQPTPIELSILYFNRSTHRLQGWDDFRLGGLGLTSAQIERTLEKQPDRTLGPPPTPTPSSPSPGSGSPGSGSPGLVSPGSGSPGASGSPAPGSPAPAAPVPGAPAGASLPPVSSSLSSALSRR